MEFLRNWQHFLADVRGPRAVNFPETPPRLTQQRSALRTEPPVDDYGNEARESYLAQRREANTQAQDLFGTGGAFNGSFLFNYVPEDGNEILLDGTHVEKQLDNALIVDKVLRSRTFIPWYSLYHICNFNAVLETLENHGRFQGRPDAAVSCARYICGQSREGDSEDDYQQPTDTSRTDAKSSAREIFAILVMIQQVDLVLDFKEAGIVDNHLPVEWDEETNRVWIRRSNARIHLGFFDTTGREKVAGKFYSAQWKVHIPFIGQGEQAIDYKLAEETILPWSRYDPPMAAGAHGEVRRVCILDAHHSFGTTPTGAQRNFALKTLTGDAIDAKKVFEQELKAFQKNTSWEHVVELCATFQKGEQCMFLFPWAEGGSLFDLMTKPEWDHPPTLDVSSSKDDFIAFTKWIHQQCGGLIEALLSIHDYLDEHPPQGLAPADDDVYGVHYDIKPENILHFIDEQQNYRYGTLKLADFGLLKYHSRDTRTQLVKYWGPADQMYKCPEYDFSEILSRKVDIWALGCVFSELLTWAIRGRGSIEIFRLDRKSEMVRMDSHGTKHKIKDDSFFARKNKSPMELIAPRLCGARDGHRDNSLQKPILKRKVIQWINDLSCVADCNGSKTFLQNFLDTIRDGMLEVERGKRFDCRMVDGFFQDCKRKGESHEDYWMFPFGILPEGVSQDAVLEIGQISRHGSRDEILGGH